MYLKLSKYVVTYSVYEPSDCQWNDCSFDYDTEEEAMKHIRGMEVNGKIDPGYRRVRLLHLIKQFTN